jgi:hypothetical protein
MRLSCGSSFYTLGYAHLGAAGSRVFVLFGLRRCYGLFGKGSEERGFPQETLNQTVF